MSAVNQSPGLAGQAGLAGKPIVITGAGRGLGRSYALHLARLGASIVVNDRDDVAGEVRDEIVAAGGSAISVIGSVTDWDFAEHLIASAVTEFGWLHGVVANAGVYHITPAIDESPDAIRTSVDSNLIGTIHVGVHALRHLVTVGGGVIVTTTSSSAQGLGGSSVYSATKGAIMSLTYSWAIEVEGTGVRVNCIRPRALTRMSHVRGTPKPGARAAEEVAPLMAYLLDDRSSALNGVVLSFDGATLEVLRKAHLVHLPSPPEWSLDSIAAAVASIPV
jgi:NAD(P)-dependent dehydrogenase (short-subunit alcohol dehydrogenase family)